MLLPPAKIIQTTDELIDLAQHLLREPLVGVDTESNNLYAYQERVCLIQFSTASADYIIDPLAIDDLTPLAPVMAASGVEKVFHAAEYDIMSMKRDFGFEFRNIFDTMFAARICGFQSVGLSTLLSEFTGVALDKSHQKDNWGRRPLSDESLHYAQKDTHYLPYLRDELYKQLQSLTRWEEAKEIFAELEILPPAEFKVYDPDGFWHIGRPHRLKRQQFAVLGKLYRWREEAAQAMDVPAFKVLPNRVLVELARMKPRTVDALRRMSGMSDAQIAQYGEQIVQVIKEGRALRRLPVPPQNTPLDPLVSDRYTALHTWRKERASERGVESDIIISKQTLWNLAFEAPSTIQDLSNISGIGPWRLANYGEELLNVLDQCRELNGG